MTFTVHYTKCIGSRCDEGVTRPVWNQYDGPYVDEQKAVRRARNLALDNGGYVCVKNETGKIVYGTDPVELDRAIREGRNRTFLEPSSLPAIA